MHNLGHFKIVWPGPAQHGKSEVLEKIGPDLGILVLAHESPARSKAIIRHFPERSNCILGGVVKFFLYYSNTKTFISIRFYCSYFS